MPLSQPTRLELDAIRALADFSGRHVLEIGAGDGRMTWPFAAQAARWVASDPDRDEISAALKALRLPPFPQALLHLGDGRQLSFPDGSFDVVFFSYSLC